MKCYTTAVLLSVLCWLNVVDAASSPPFHATAHHEQTFLERRAIVPQSHADMFTARHQSLERREYVAVPVGVAPTKDLQRRAYIPVPVGFAKTAPPALERRGYLSTHVAAHREPTIGGRLERRAYIPVPVGFAKTAPPALDRRGYLSTHVAAHREPTIGGRLERRATRPKKKQRKQVVKKKRVVKKKKPKGKMNLSRCIEELRHGYPAYDNMREAVDAYHHVLTMFPEQLIADEQHAKEISNDITLGLQSARTYLTLVKLQTVDDELAWRKALILGQASWLGAKVNLAMRLTSKVKPMPQLKWLSNVAKSVSSALSWLWGKKETREARKRQLTMNGSEKKATKNLHSWMDSAMNELNKESDKLTSTLCSRLLG